MTKLQMLTKYWYGHSKIKMHSKFLEHMNIRSVFLRTKLAMHHSHIPVLIQYTVILITFSELTHQGLFFIFIFWIYCLQILSLQLSVVDLKLPLLMGLCMREIMRHLVQPHIMWLTQKGGQLVMLDILVGPIMLSIQVLHYHNSQIL